MIKVGCVGLHPEDVSFLLSGEIAELLRSKNCIIEFASGPPGEPSVDVLLIAANKMNKLTSMLDLSNWTWVMLSSNKADAWHAWNMGAVYFLLRPFSMQEFQKALERVEQSWYWKKQISPPHTQSHWLELQLTKGRKVPVRLNDILYFEAQGEVTCVYLNLPGHEKITTTRNLGFWERQLDPELFVRTHKKYLVHVAHVTAVFPDEIAVQRFTLPIAKRRRKEVEKSVFAYQLRHRSGEYDPGAAAQHIPVVDKK